MQKLRAYIMLTGLLCFQLFVSHSIANAYIDNLTDDLDFHNIEKKIRDAADSLGQKFKELGLNVEQKLQFQKFWAEFKKDTEQARKELQELVSKKNDDKSGSSSNSAKLDERITQLKKELVNAKDNLIAKMNQVLSPEQKKKFDEWFAGEDKTKSAK